MDINAVFIIIREVWDRVNQGDMAGGRSILEDALRKDPRNPQLVAELAKFDIFVGKAEVGRDRLLELRSWYPGESWIELLLAYAEGNNNNRDAAIAYAEQAIRTGDDESIAAQAELYLAFYREQWDTILDELRDVPNLADMDLVLASFRITALMSTAQYEEARVGVLDSIRVMPGSWWDFQILGLIEMNLNNLEAAQAALEHAHSLAPYEETTLGYLAGLSYRRRRWLAALRYLWLITLAVLKA